MGSFGRDDIKEFMSKYKEEHEEGCEEYDNDESSFGLLSECGCQESERSIYDENADSEYSSYDLREIFSPSPETAPCPETYNSTTEAFIDNPESLVSMLLPVMRELGIGCPASMCKAMGDLLATAQEANIVSTFNTDSTQGEY